MAVDAVVVDIVRVLVVTAMKPSFGVSVLRGSLDCWAGQLQVSL